MSDEKTVGEMMERLAEIADALDEADDDGNALSIVKMAGGSGRWFRVRCGGSYADGTSIADALDGALKVAESRLAHRAAEVHALAAKLRAASPTHHVHPLPVVRHDVRLAVDSDFDGVHRIIAGEVGRAAANFLKNGGT